ncbi:hypothetical protein, partial [Pseudomonas syringae group genomosp. 7]|uniref:hypothetical protein n=1 Tax=Pseudomonas syringae group genomosp. 7 TaxID=251699 RepID=UPI00376F94E0
PPTSSDPSRTAAPRQARLLPGLSFSGRGPAPLRPAMTFDTLAGQAGGVSFGPRPSCGPSLTHSAWRPFK